jgi:hypothetical protein
MSPGFAGVTTSLYGYYDFRLRQTTLQASVGYSLAIKDFGTSLDFSAFVGNASAGNYFPDSKWGYGKVKESYNYYGIGVNVPYKLAENAQVHVGASWSANDKFFTNSGSAPASPSVSKRKIICLKHLLQPAPSFGAGFLFEFSQLLRQMRVDSPFLTPSC